MGFLDTIAAGLPLNRDRKGGILRIKHQGTPEADAITG